jgi:hypothetical protein
VGVARSTLVASPEPMTADEAGALDRTRSALLVRLHRRPDDLAATVELQAIDARSAEMRSHAGSDERNELVRGGLSGVEVIRRWVRSKIPRRIR